VIVAESIVVLKVATMALLSGTPEAPLAGTVEITVGGISGADDPGSETLLPPPVSTLTAPLRAKALPCSREPVSAEMDIPASMFP
jgi:hypothetical protein